MKPIIVPYVPMILLETFEKNPRIFHSKRTLGFPNAKAMAGASSPGLSPAVGI